jgi:hypothetical protein
MASATPVTPSSCNVDQTNDYKRHRKDTEILFDDVTKRYKVDNYPPLCTLDSLALIESRRQDLINMLIRSHLPPTTRARAYIRARFPANLDVMKEPTVYLKDGMLRADSRIEHLLATQLPTNIPFFSAETSSKVVREQVAEHIVTNMKNNFDVVVMTYGQNGSGKSYSLLGDDKEDGIVQATMAQLGAYNGVYAQAFQVYMGKAYNIPLSSKIEGAYIPNSKDTFILPADPFTDIKSDKLTKTDLRNPIHVLAWFKCIKSATLRRDTSWNRTSSRSQVYIRLMTDNPNYGNVTFVDLPSPDNAPYDQTTELGREASDIMVSSQLMASLFRMYTGDDDSVRLRQKKQQGLLHSIFRWLLGSDEPVRNPPIGIIFGTVDGFFTNVPGENNVIAAATADTLNFITSSLPENRRFYYTLEDIVPDASTRYFRPPSTVGSQTAGQQPSIDATPGLLSSPSAVQDLSSSLIIPSAYSGTRSATRTRGKTQTNNGGAAAGTPKTKQKPVEYESNSEDESDDDSDDEDYVGSD